MSLVVRAQSVPRLDDSRSSSLRPSFTPSSLNRVFSSRGVFPEQCVLSEQCVLTHSNSVYLPTRTVWYSLLPEQCGIPYYPNSVRYLCHPNSVRYLCHPNSVGYLRYPNSVGYPRYPNSVGYPRYPNSGVYFGFPNSGVYFGFPNSVPTSRTVCRPPPEQCADFLPTSEL